MKLFKNRTIGFWAGFIAACLMLGADLAFICFNYKDKTFSMITWIFILLGVLSEVVVAVSEFKVAPLLPPICYGIGLGMHLYLGLPTLSDVANGVNFVGGNPRAVIIFGSLFLVGTLGGIWSSFANQRKI